MKKTVFSLVFCCFAICHGFFLAYAENNQPDIRKIVDTVDRLYRSSTSRTDVKMTISTQNWERTLRMIIWTRDLNRTFIHIAAPKKDAGIATLRIDSSMWNYFPKIDKVIKVPPSMMMSSWMGSDFTNDDLVKESTLLGDYHAKFASSENQDENNFYIELLPKEKTATVWGKIIMIIQKADLIPLEQIFFDEHGEKIRVMKFYDIKTFGSRRVPATLELVSLKHKDKKTILHYEDAEFDAKIPDSIFTRRNLQKKR